MSYGVGPELRQYVTFTAVAFKLPFSYLTPTNASSY